MYKPHALDIDDVIEPSVSKEDYEELKRENERLNTKLSAWVDMAKKELGLNENEEQDIEWSRMVVRQVIAENERLKTEVKRLVAVRNDMGEMIGDHVNEIVSLKNALPGIAARAVEGAGELIRYEMGGPKDCDSLEEFLDGVAAKIRAGEVEL